MAHNQHVVILGAGISGLSLAWYLKRKNPSLEMTILEKSGRAGGWLDTDQTTPFHFEKGARTFLTSKSSALLTLISELGLNDQLLYADMHTLPRYIWLNGQLEKMPTHVISALFSPLTRGLITSFTCEWRRACHVGDETVWDFITRRFGSHTARVLFDPLVRGIFGGDSRQISMKSCFPLLKEWEETYGSITRGLLASLIHRKRKEKARVFALKGGMHTLIHALIEKIGVKIHYHCAAERVERLAERWNIQTTGGVFSGDALFSALPAFEAFRLFPSIEALSGIPHKGFMVVNVGYDRPVLPIHGFGYLTASSDHEEIVGVIFDSCIFPEKQQTRLSIKLRERDCTQEQYVETALRGIHQHLDIRAKPNAIVCQRAERAIPQYGVGHLEAVKVLDRPPYDKVYFVGNYFSGVGVNHCILRSKQIADTASD